MHTSMPITPTFTSEASALLLSYSDCYSEVTPCTVLAYTYWAGFHDAYGCLRHTH